MRSTGGLDPAANGSGATDTKGEDLAVNPNELSRDALAQPEVAAEAAEQLLAQTDPRTLPAEAAAQPEVAEEVAEGLLEGSEDNE